MRHFAKKKVCIKERRFDQLKKYKYTSALRQSSKENSTSGGKIPVTSFFVYLFTISLN